MDGLPTRHNSDQNPRNRAPPFVMRCYGLWPFFLGESFIRSPLERCPIIVYWSKCCDQYIFVVISKHRSRYLQLVGSTSRFYFVRLVWWCNISVSPWLTRQHVRAYFDARWPPFWHMAWKIRVCFLFQWACMRGTVTEHLFFKPDFIIK